MKYILLRARVGQPTGSKGSVEYSYYIPRQHEMKKKIVTVSQHFQCSRKAEFMDQLIYPICNLEAFAPLDQDA